MSLPAGTLNRRIDIEKLSGAKDALNRPIMDDWIPHVLRLPSDPRGQTGMGVIRAGAEGVNTPINAYSYRIRYRRDITTAMRVNDGGEILDITDIRHDKKNREWTDLICKASVNG